MMSAQIREGEREREREIKNRELKHDSEAFFQQIYKENF